MVTIQFYLKLVLPNKCYPLLKKSDIWKTYPITSMTVHFWPVLPLPEMRVVRIFRPNYWKLKQLFSDHCKTTETFSLKWWFYNSVVVLQFRIGPMFPAYVS